MEFPAKILERLRPHQRGPAQELDAILSQHRSGLDLSIMGAGKTYVGAAVMAKSKLPWLIVCPKIAVSTWERAASHFEDEFDIIGYEKLRTGSTPFGFWSGGPPSDRREREYLVCQNCQQTIPWDSKKVQPCYCRRDGLHYVEVKVKPHRYGQFTFAREVAGVLFDEVHRCGRDSLNADMLIAARRQNKFTLGLSATIASSPLHLRAIGYAAGLHNLEDFYSFARRFGCGKIPGLRGFHWLTAKEKQLETMAEIRSLIIPARGIRITENDIPNFPKCDIQAELYDLPEKDTAELNKLHLEVADSLVALEKRMESDIAPEAAMTKILRGRQKIELLKVPLVTELGEDYMEKGFSVVFFVNFQQTIDELKKRFPKAGIISGLNSKTRTQVVDAFQANDCRVLIVQSECGGVCLSLQDLDGFHPRVGLVMPCHSAVTFRQLAGRLPRDGGKSPAYYRVIFASKSVEVPMRGALAGKLNNLDALNDSDCRAQNLRLNA